MTIAQLLHNPKAGDKDHTEEKLIALIEAEGFNAVYASIKEDGWENFEPDAEILAIMGGDGTVRRVAGALIKQNKTDSYLLGLLPMGTANNIAKTLQIQGDANELVKAWHHKKTTAMDAAIIKGLPDDNFFIEGFGYGIFPQLMVEMKKLDKKKLDTPAKEMTKALEVLHNIVLNHEANYCRIVVDGVSHTGHFILAEVMNICSVGPNLQLAPEANPGDGVFEVVLIPEKQRLHFADFLQHKLAGNECPPFPYQTISGKQIQIKWDDTLMHADDELITVKKPVEIDIEIRPSALKFLI
jgi:diacylglycerol kinase (ATP)